jgi:hypothetical protein
MDSQADLTQLSRTGFIFGYATVDLYRILHDFALDPRSPEYRAPLNELAHSRQLADPDDHAIVAMNVDTPYSYAWLNLRAEPVVLTLSSFEPGRYVSAERFDLFAYILGYVSPRTNGTRGGRFLVAGPGWEGSVPGWVDGVFRSTYPNPLKRYVINSAYLAHLTADGDGGHTILVQHTSPGPAAESNWLPCPAGPFGLTFRTYLPSEAIRTGAWTAPPVTRIDR